jgi:nucleoid DNA-binding protein
LNSKTLINKVRIKSSFNRELSESIFKFIFSEIQRIVKEKKSFSIDELGEFTVIHRKMQTVTDEANQAEILLPPKEKIVFKPSKELIGRLKD